MVEAHLLALQDRLRYRFTDNQLFNRALTHRSFGTVNNERLEFLGDAVIDLAVSDTLLNRFEEAPEGHLSALRSQLVRRESLAEAARGLRLSEALILGESAGRSGGYQQESILADTLEALVGAVYLDGGWESAKAVVDELLPVDEAMLDQLKDKRDAKSRLQEFLQGRGDSLPDYQLVEVSGPGHDQNFKVTCSLTPAGLVFEGMAGSRKAAEQKAAELALDYLTQEENS